MNLNKLIDTYSNTYCELFELAESCDYFKSQNSDFTNNNKGLLLELYIALITNSYLYNDVNDEIKHKYSLPTRDMGIDILTINDKNEIKSVAQCKNYNGQLSHHALGTFYHQLAILAANEQIDINFGSRLSKMKKSDLLKLINEQSIKKYLAIGEFTKFDISKDILDVKVIKYEDYKLLYDKIKNNEFNKEINKDEENEIEIKEKENKSENEEEIIDKELNISLRDYQLECIENLNSFMNEDKNIFRVSLPCGTGKTVILYEFIKEHPELNFIIVVPRISIAENMKNKYFKDTANYIWTKTNKYSKNKNINIYVYNSFITKLNNDKIPIDNNTVLLIDEAHHIYNPKYYAYEHINDKIKIQKKLENIFNKIILFSATIENADYRYELRKAIKNRYITDFRFDINFVPFDEENEEKKENEDNENKKEENENKIIKLTKKEYYICKNIVFYKHRLIFCNTIENANKCKNMLELYNEENKEFIDNVEISPFTNIYVISKDTSENKRNKIIEEFENDISGNTIIISVNVLNEGVDIPCAESCIFIDDRNSPVNIVQCIGRIMRNYIGKLYGKVVLFANCENSAENKYCKYIESINKAYSIDLPYLKKRIRFFYDFDYNDEIKHISKIKECKDKLFERIERFYFTFEEKIKLCQMFWDKYQRKPKPNDFIKFDDESDERIYYIYNDIMHAKHHKTELYNEMIKIFGELEYRKIFTGDKIAACKAFYEQFKRVPKSSDNKFEFDGQIFNIYEFYRKTRNSDNIKLKEQIEKIFGKYEDINQQKQLDKLEIKNRWLKYCKIFVELTTKQNRKIKIMKGDKLFIKNLKLDNKNKPDLNNYIIYRRGELRYNKENNYTVIKTNVIIPHEQIISIDKFIDGIKSDKNLDIKDKVEEIIGYTIESKSKNDMYDSKLNDCITLYNYLNKNSIKGWDGFKFNVSDNKIKLKLNNTIKQLNTFITNVRNSTELYNKFVNDLKENECDMNVEQTISKIDALKEQIKLVGEYYILNNEFPKQQGKDDIQKSMKKLKGRKDSNTYLEAIKEMKDLNELNNYLEELK